ncbi:MAG: tyrosine-type recombinase/integrase [Butyrivibrio sp.]|nr:tyrosine-type recombinase/integrase [Butyrivibrio sp.]
MNNLHEIITNYLGFCEHQKRLDVKTLRAYKIDLTQFSEQVSAENISDIGTEILEVFIADLHRRYKPKTVKRKLASVKALFHYMEYRNYIAVSPFNRIYVKFREPVILPKTIPLPVIEKLLSTIYSQCTTAKTLYRRRNAVRDAAVIEVLFATGMRISELCSLKPNSVNLTEYTVLIYGKGAKERCLQIGNPDVRRILDEYHSVFQQEIASCQHFFVNQCGQPLSDQAVRRMIKHYASIANIDLHITPHMFRHTFATGLLDAEVDIRYIQEMLGHSSINITQIYTHVSMSKQMNILATKHPRKDLKV